MFPILLLALSAPPEAPLAPLDFLAGHCWRGEFAPGGDVDTHCFDRVGDQLRDRHEVLRAGKRIYWGETLYRWDAAAGTIRYVYASGTGGRSEGSVRGAGRDLDFGTEVFTGRNGRTIEIRTRWLRVAGDAYEAVVEASDPTGIPRRTRYRRIR